MVGFAAEARITCAEKDLGFGGFRAAQCGGFATCGLPRHACHLECTCWHRFLKTSSHERINYLLLALLQSKANCLFLPIL
jgi:hypothetical protein